MRPLKRSHDHGHSFVRQECAFEEEVQRFLHASRHRVSHSLGDRST